MITIIDNYRNLPIGKYMDILALSQDESVDALTQQVKTISILTDIPEDEVLSLPLEQYRELAGKTRFLEKEYDGKLMVAKSYKVGGFELIPVKDFSKIITSQYVDYQNFAKEGEKYFVESLSTMLIPKGKRYCEGYDVADVHKAIRENLSVADVLSLSAFFLKSWVKSIKHFQTFSAKEIQKIPDKALRESLMKRMQEAQEMISKTNGDGLPM